MPQVLLKSLGIAGYRSFKTLQHFENFGEMNVIIGQNNAGKSNVFGFLEQYYQQFAKRESRFHIAEIDKPFGDSPNLAIAVFDSIRMDRNGNVIIPANHPALIGASPTDHRRQHFHSLFCTIFKAYMNEIGKDSLWWYLLPNGTVSNMDKWMKAFSAVSQNDISNIWTGFTGAMGGSLEHWIKEILRQITVTIPYYEILVIPAIRQITAGSASNSKFNGTGIIDRLARLQNPDHSRRDDKNRFIEIRDFVRTVIGCHDAEIEIPYDRNTITVHMDGKSLPIESLGTGIHEVIILAAAATTFESTIICIEEPEIHLNPLLQRKLMKYLRDNTTNQYFLSTHSPVFMDAKNIEIYHIQMQDGESIVDRISSNSEKSIVCEDLGYHPSDLLQSNCIIWVEGPSDRVYLNAWIKDEDSTLEEGVDYSIMFYGGRLASHLSNSEAIITEFISLRSLNRRGAIIIDSDRATKSAGINPTKQRLISEFSIKQGFAWVTEGREIENYLDPSNLAESIRAIHPTIVNVSEAGKYQNALKITSKKGDVKTALKVDVARYYVKNFTASTDRFDLSIRVADLVKFIKESNPNT